MHTPMLMVCFLGFLLVSEARKLEFSVTRASSRASVSGSGTATANCAATNGNTANCNAVGAADPGNRAVSVAVGTADTGDVNVVAVATALGGGDREAIAVAIGQAVDSAGGGDGAAQGLADVFVTAVNEGSGVAVAKGIADGVVKGGEVQKGIVVAVAKIVNERGCEFIRPTFAGAFAQASETGNAQGFASAFDVDVKVSECLYPACASGVNDCCLNSSDASLCGVYSLFSSTPRIVLSCSDCAQSHCICP